MSLLCNGNRCGCSRMPCLRLRISKEKQGICLDSHFAGDPDIALDDLVRRGSGDEEMGIRGEAEKRKCGDVDTWIRGCLDTWRSGEAVDGLTGV